jgi:hypothetical protein
MLVFVRLINSVLCEISMYFESTDAYDVYASCLRAANGTAEDRECYSQLTDALGDAVLAYVSCLF